MRQQVAEERRDVIACWQALQKCYQLWAFAQIIKRPAQLKEGKKKSMYAHLGYKHFQNYADFTRIQFSASGNSPIVNKHRKDSKGSTSLMPDVYDTFSI